MGAIGYVWGLDGFWLGGVVDVRVLSLCAGLDCEELVKGQDARLAAFPACIVMSTCSCLTRRVIEGY